MAVVGVFAKADVGDDQEIVGGVFCHADGLGNDSGVGKGVGAGGVFVFGYAEEDHAAQAQFDGL